MPAPTVNGIAFGGPNMDELLVTSTSNHYFNYFEAIPILIPVNNSLAGSLFLIKNVCAKGCPNKRIINDL